MKKTLLVIIALAVMTGAAYGASIVNSAHDLSTGNFIGASVTTSEVCVFCHTPHQATSAAGQEPLWNHVVSQNPTYGVYASATMNATPAEVGGQAVGSQSVSALCLSCHDGTVAVNAQYNPPNLGSPGTPISMTNASSAFIGTSLTDDHPVNFTLQDSINNGDTEIQAPTSAVLFNGSVQCASCHDVHDPANSPFLRISNANSALCLDCHIK